MGLIKRLQRITSGRVRAFLDSVDDPETVLPQLVAELEEKAAIAVNAEAKALTAVKSAQRKLDEAEGRIQRLGRGAALALKQGDERTAREALEQQVRAEKEAESHKDALTRAEAALKDAHDARLQLAGQLEELKVRRDELLSRVRSASAQTQARETLQKPAEGLLAEVARVEEKLDKDESQLEIHHEIAGPRQGSLDERLRRLQREAEFDERLGKLHKEE